MKQKGITLVALVVTIIILLILAGVTIAQISGENGLFSRVRQAVEKYKDASTEEEQQILEIEKFVSEFSTTEQEGVTVKITKLEVTAGTDSIEVLVEVEGEPTKIEYSIDNGKTYKTKEGDETSRTYKYENLKPGGYFIKVRVYDGEGKYQEGTSDIVTVTPITTAEAEDVLKDKTFLTGEGIIKTGIIETQSTIDTTLDAGTSIPIPAGYYSGEGTVAAKSLAEQTPGNATSDQIVSGYSAWVAGNPVEGNIPNKGGDNIEVTEKETPIPRGYYDGSGKITTNISSGLVLLWKNDNPTASFGPQTISLDLTDYSEVVVLCEQDASRCKIGSNGNPLYYDASSTDHRKRNYSASTTGVTFETGIAYNDVNFPVTRNQYTVPEFIYGMPK